ncbi:hypothetical protein [Lentzea aerocolonigenes]|uniref:hypothetical protein n=1 Tax=Lentzea aerocolonigenes TaxID=68170 RepID=UPI000750708D|nr:hypothetical protein [Lentzea aerocolonigenes]MCP2242592.1 hypothetical protein [Lentzea aerocolonigenes]
MAAPVTPDPVMTLDLRTPQGADGPVLSSRVLVIDTTDALAEHHAHFERLARLPQVTGVVLVAIGGIETVLRTPSALAGVGVTLWVTDGSGVPWEGGSQRPGAGGGESTVDDLLVALRFPKVFDRVVAEVGAMPHQAASPGLAVDYATVEPGMMRALKLRALRQLVATGVAARLHDRESTELTSVVRSATEGDATSVREGSPLHEAMARAHRELTAAERAIGRWRSWRGLVGLRKTHRVVLDRLSAAGDALLRYHRVARRALEDVDSSLADGYPPPSELLEQGLPSPAPVNSEEMADAVRKAVTTELLGGRTLPGIAEQARRLGNRLGAARSLAVTEQDAAADLQTWARGLIAPPPVKVWPIPVTHLLPVMFLTSLLSTALPGFGAWPMLLMVPLWTVLVALLSAPCPAGADLGLVFGATVFTSVAGAAAGLRFPGGLSSDVLIGAGVLVVLVAVSLVSAWIAWRAVAGRWRDAVPLRQAQNATKRLSDQVSRTIEQRWSPADRSRRLADSLLVVAAGVDAVAEVFGDVISGVEDTGHTFGGDSSAGLAEVLHHDLVAITLEVLRPSFDAIASRMPLSADAQRSSARAKELVAAYDDHLEQAGLRELPAFVTDEGPRRRLAETLWQGSASSRRILQLTERSRMTQLCAAEDVRLLQADNARMVHFASADMDLPPVDAGCDEIIRTRGDAVGAVRLTPILARYVERAVHAQGDQR